MWQNIASILCEAKIVNSVKKKRDVLGKLVETSNFVAVDAI